MKPGEEHSPEERLECIGFWAIDKRVPHPGLTLAESCRKTRPSVESKSFVTLETERPFQGGDGSQKITIQKNTILFVLVHAERCSIWMC